MWPCFGVEGGGEVSKEGNGRLMGRHAVFEKDGRWEEG